MMEQLNDIADWPENSLSKQSNDKNAEVVACVRKVSFNWIFYIPSKMK